MVDFSNFGSLKIDGRTAKYELVEMQETPIPWLIVRPIGADNKPYLNALLREFGGNQRQMQRVAGTLNAENIARNREINRRLFPEFVVTDWGGVKDKHGAEVPFSVEACRDLFAQLPGYMIDGVRAFCDDPSNFVAGGLSVDVEEVAGN